jgi:hypothetical protein
MMKKLIMMVNWISLFFVLTGFILINDVESSESSIQIILDSSRFSGEKLGERTKLDVAVNDLLDILKTLDLNCKISLRVHGGKTVKDSEKCKNTSLLIPFDKFDPKKWEISLKGLKPLGEPSILAAIKSSMADFPSGKGLRKNIILINFSPKTCGAELKELDNLNNTTDNRIILHLLDYGADLKTRKELGYPVGVTGGSFYTPLTQNEFKKQISETLELSLISGDLLVETRDFDGKEIYFEYQILEQKNQRLIYKHETNSVKSIKPGKYTLKIKTIPEKVLSDVVIKDGELEKIQIDNFGQLLIRINNPNGLESRIHYTIRTPDTTETFLGSGDSGEPIFILEGKYKLTIHTIPFTVVETQIEKGKKVLYTVRNLGFVNIEIKNKPETLKKLKVVIRSQKDNKYVVSAEVPRAFPMVEGVYKFIFYTENKITKENIVIKPMETTTVSVDLLNP